MAVWTGQSFTLNQILTSTQMNQLQADITALAEGASGAPKIESDALQNYSPFNYMDFGDASSGSVTISADTEYPAGVYEFSSLTINSGYTLSKDDSGGGPFVIKCTGTVTIAGTLRAENNYWTEGDIGAAGGAGQYTSTGSWDPAGKNTWLMTGGQISGSQSDSGTPPIDATEQQVRAALMTGSPFNGGAQGGQRWQSTGNPPYDGGNGGGVIIISAETIDIQATGTIDVKGVDGGGSGDNGTGGGGGGVAILMYKTLTENGTIVASGGAAGGSGVFYGNNGTNGGAGVVIRKQVKT